jgi:hypothetical protein
MKELKSFSAYKPMKIALKFDSKEAEPIGFRLF